MLMWYSSIALMLDALQVMDMRLRQIAGGNGTPDEMLLMVTEKIDAAAKAGSILLQGGSCDQVVAYYSKIVCANAERLTG